MRQPSRTELSLDGTWEARPDPDDDGLTQCWFVSGTPFDHQVRVPGPWQADGGVFRGYAGVAWFRRRFERPAGIGGRFSIRFGAVDHSARAWLNGREIGSHDGGYLPFELPADLALRDGVNELVVRVEDGPHLPDRTYGKQGTVWYTPTSGIWQPVTLTVRPREFIATVRCLPLPHTDTVRIVGRCVIDERQLLRIDVVDHAGAQVATHEIDVTPDHASFDAAMGLPRPRLWEPIDPNLYHAVATLTAEKGRPRIHDQVTARFGMRTIEAREGQVWLNGHRQEVRGALDQGLWTETLYSPPSREALATEIDRARELGFNLLRKHIKVEDPRAFDLADELGMMIWAEAPNPGRFTAESAAAVRRDLVGMIERDLNHPSIVIWGCYNEDWGIEHLWDEPDRQAWLRSLVAEVRSLDPSRLVCDNSGWAHVSTDINDYHEYFSLPERSGAFEARLDEIEHDPDNNFAAGHRAAGEPVIVSEIGAWMIPDIAHLRSGLGGDGAWFDHAAGYQRGPEEDGPQPGDPLPAIATMRAFESRLIRAGLDRVFASQSDVHAHAQRRGARSIADQLGGLRRRPSIAGYIVTELSDTEWEANGWLDHWREPKPVAGHLRSANGPVAIVARPDRRNALEGARVEIDLAVVNDGPGALVGARVLLDGRPVELASGAASVGPYSRLDGLRVAWTVPAGESAPIDLAIALESEGSTIAETTVELARTAAPDLAREPIRTTGPTLPRIFRQRLERHGYRMPRDWDPEADLAIVHRVDERAIAFARAGGRVLYLVGDLVETPDPLGLCYRQLAAGESWEMHTGVAWARSGMLRPAPVREDLGWEAVAWFPRIYVLADCLAPDDIQLAGWFEGWGAFAGAFAVARKVGRGRLLTTTFRLGDAFGVDPVATLLLDRFVDLTAEPLDAGTPGSTWAAPSQRSLPDSCSRQGARPRGGPR
jgi:hypothetical protein